MYWLMLRYLDVRQLFELAPNKSLDGSLGSPSHETVNSLAMVQRGLKMRTSTSLQKHFQHWLTSMCSKARTRTVGCLEFAINFLTVIDEVMKRITKLPFILYNHPNSYYEIPIDFANHSKTTTSPTCVTSIL